MKLKVLKAVGAEYEAVAESGLGVVAKAERTEFHVRIPVPAGAQFGAYSSGGVPVCYETSVAGDTYGTAFSDIPLGMKAKPESSSEKSLVALLVTVEPDADGDGF